LFLSETLSWGLFTQETLPVWSNGCLSPQNRANNPFVFVGTKYAQSHSIPNHPSLALSPPPTPGEGEETPDRSVYLPSYSPENHNRRQGMKRLIMGAMGALLFTLAGCGGGGSDSGSPVIDPISPVGGNAAPIANAGPDQNVKTGSLVTLSGSGSDADGDPLVFDWAFTSWPSGSAAALPDPTAAQPTFIADVEGTYVLSLIVNDGTVNSQEDIVTITAMTPLEIGVPYTAADGLTVTMHSIVITEKTNSFTYAINYTLQNQTAGQILMGTFKLYFNDDTGLHQNTVVIPVFSGGFISRSYIFEAPKSQIPTVIGYHHDHLDSNTPPSGSLVWEMELP
jgi:hypothetical protein